MIEVLFTCILNNVMKEISAGTTDTRIGRECRVMIDDKVVGSAQHNPEFCTGLASKIKNDLEKKGFKCSEKSIK